MTSHSPQTIILAAGRSDPKNMNTGLFNSAPMIPVNGKPVIGWILDEELKKRPGSKVTVVTRLGDKSLQRFLTHFYISRHAVRLHYVNPANPEQDTILASLQAGLEDVPTDSAVNVILGDTLILDDCSERDVIFTSDRIDEARTWCLVETRPDGEITHFFDKELVSLDRKLAVAGYYCLSSSEHLKAAVRQAIQNGRSQISDALAFYQIERPLFSKTTTRWFDFGHVDGIVKAKYALLDTRFFNSLRVDEVRGIIEKRSTNKEKLKDEAFWFEQLPSQLKIFTPRLIRHWEDGENYHIQQEMYGYPTLAELYLYSDMSVGAWRAALRKLLSVHSHFSGVFGDLDVRHFENIYREKTWSRLDKLKTQSPDWARLLEQEYVTINDETYAGLPLLRDKINRKLDTLIRSAKPTVVHGDYCFSNILFDPSTHFVRVIDPRGRFGVQSIFGDPRYDIAKLRHSAVGLYDFINSGFFRVEDCDGGAFRCQIFEREHTREVAYFFDELVQEHGYRPTDIRLIEALLFLSMVPLHADYPMKQKMFFINGLRLMNQALLEK
jgi:hypothetical protein